jgi:hypothetical protein
MWEFRFYRFGFLVDFGHLLGCPRLTPKMVTSHGDRCLAGEETGYLAANPPR